MAVCWRSARTCSLLLASLPEPTLQVNGLKPILPDLSSPAKPTIIVRPSEW